MKNKISNFSTGFPDSVVGKRKNKKRKDISPDQKEDNLSSKRKKYLASNAKPKTVSEIDNKIMKKKGNQIPIPTTYSSCIKDIAVQDLKEPPPNTAGTVISEIENFAVVPSSLPSYLTLFSSLKSNFNSPLPHLSKQRSTSTPVAGSEWQKLHFDIAPLTPMKEFIPLSLPKQTNIEFEVISEELPSQPTTSVIKRKCKLMLTSEKLKLGLLDKIPKFCPFCDYVCERLLYLHIEKKHHEKLKLPISTSVVGINKIISSFSKNKKIMQYWPGNNLRWFMGAKSCS
ncbi:PREDICTED: uncharacterized protein LOC107163261 isoform X3 [Diuraphis noxia]|uniref:uncharacterized protein LOC107163261 isoform X3 n=1 Tax=Diuraphis noxia TaxID=143948 RepID=UPI000763AADF|nr:PREDICTED: uncharacterized protein LOC107163261 isoform X3 [Diuraphis noxia]